MLAGAPPKLNPPPAVPAGFASVEADALRSKENFPDAGLFSPAGAADAGAAADADVAPPPNENVAGLLGAAAGDAGA